MLAGGWYVTRATARVCLWAYYRLFRVHGADRIPRDGPLLVVANHPNALVDAAAVLCAVPRPLAFVARRRALSFPIVGPLLRVLGLAPVVRLGEASDDGPSALTARLQGGGAAAVYPEGPSHVKPALRDIRAGAASLALEAESASAFRLGLRVLPVGLHYEPRQRFRGEVHVRVGDPFGIGDLGDVPHAEAVQEVQERIASALRPLVFHLDRVDLEPLVEGVADVYDEHQRADATALVPRPRGEIVHLAGSCLNHFVVADPPAVDRARRLLRRYERLADRAGIHAKAVESRARPLRSLLGFVWALFATVAGFPVFLLGCLTAYLPYRLVDTLARSLARRRDPTTLPRLRIVVGAIVFPLFWGGLAFLVYRWSQSPRLAVFCFLVFLASGLFARIYAEQVVSWWQRLAGLRPLRKRGIRRVARARALLLEHVQALASRYHEETGARILPPRAVRWHQRVPWRAVATFAVVALGAWFAWGLRDTAVEELPDRPSPWATLTPDRARKTLESDARALTSLLDTLAGLESATYALKASFDAGGRTFTSVEDDLAIRRALLTFLSCRSELFRLAWFYRAPDHPEDPEVGGRAFLISYVAALELVRRGMQLVALFDGSPRAIRKLNEADQALGLPGGIYDRIRRNLSNTSIYDELTAATVRCEHLHATGWTPTVEPWRRLWTESEQGRAVVRRLADKQWDYKWDAALARAQASAEETRYAASSFFAGLIGGVRVREGDLAEGLISDAQVEHLAHDVLQPGDILLERRNWALTNVFLPGFWTHAALYVGGVEGVRALGIEDDERVEPHMVALARTDDEGHAYVVVEALAPGVILSTLQHSVGEADALCVLRPRLPREAVAEAMAHAIGNLGKPYDFDFDFFSSDKLVCTELVYRAYDGPLDFELQTVMGRETLPALEILRKWVEERGQADAQLELVCFFDAAEDEGVAREADADALPATLHRSGVTLFRPDVADAVWPRVLAIALGALLLAAFLFLRRRD